MLMKMGTSQNKAKDNQNTHKLMHLSSAGKEHLRLINEEKDKSNDLECQVCMKKWQFTE